MQLRDIHNQNNQGLSADEKKVNDDNDDDDKPWLSDVSDDEALQRACQEQALRDQIAKYEQAEAARKQSEAARLQSEAARLQSEAERKRSEAVIQGLRDQLEKLRAETGVVVEWSCYTDNGFVAYDSTTSDAIEAGYQRSKTSKAAGGGGPGVTFDRAGVSYRIDFADMKQKRTDGS